MAPGSRVPLAAFIVRFPWESLQMPKKSVDNLACHYTNKAAESFQNSAALFVIVIVGLEHPFCGLALFHYYVGFSFYRIGYAHTLHVVILAICRR